MRLADLTLILLVTWTTSCSKPGVTFQQGGELSAAEKAAIAGFHPGLAGWGPDYTALWERNGIARHVCLRAMIGGIVWPYEVFTFDRDGRVVDANIIKAGSGYTPKALLGIEPLRIRCQGMRQGEEQTVGLAYSSEEGRRKMRQLGDFGAKSRLEIEDRKRSSGENVRSLQQVLIDIRAGKTNSEK